MDCTKRSCLSALMILLGALPAVALADDAEPLLSGVRQMTFAGERAGEGYFSPDGSEMVFQSERMEENPFYQIYLTDLETGDTQRISPGSGKTTCAWIHPSGDRVLFASTHEDPEALNKQQAELELRASGKERRYSWDYDPQYELYEWQREDGSYRRLTDAEGYDAEGSYSPDGTKIAFASNRAAYSGELSKADRERLAADPSQFIDLYLMDADGSNVRRITTSHGYDGGPFFSPDGQRLCFRRFSPDGATAEIMTVSLDGSDEQQLTSLGAMSWAPFYHPSGDYLIFTTNLHGFGNFELYLVDAAGKTEPVRVTHTDGFDGLPVFLPGGDRVAWTSTRSAGAKSQIFLAGWNDAEARRMLGLEAEQVEEADSALAAGRKAAKQTGADFTAADIGRHVDYLCRPELGGRLTGTPGEQKATAYVAAYLESLGLEPAGADGTYFHPFEFTAGVELGPENRLTSGDHVFEVGREWLPVSFSLTGTVEPTEVVFAGYGIVAPETDGSESYDSYVHLDVTDRWVLVLRGMPTDLKPEERQRMTAYSGLRYKAMVARDRGAKGLIIVNGPASGFRRPLVPLRLDGALSGTSIAVLSVAPDVVEPWLQAADTSLAEQQKKLDGGEPQMGFTLDGVTVSATVDLETQRRTGRNVLARLVAGDSPADQVVIVGAHIDHLGTGDGANSLAREDEQGGIHRGADDNASGVAAMLEMAQYLASLKDQGRLDARRDVIFAAWSGEELGLVGSSAFVDEFADLLPEATVANDSAASLYPSIAANINLDMVGRLRDKLVLQGIGSSPLWRQEIESRNIPVGLPLTLQSDSYLPTDASTFYLRGVPILSAFTGSHSEYHTPRDTPETLNYEGAAQVARLMALLTRSVATAEQPPEYSEQKAPERQARARLTAYLGTIPDYAAGDVTGVKLSGVASDGPADEAGLKGGDVIVELAGRKIENIYDYTYAIEALKIGEATPVTVVRDGERVELTVTPGSRD